MLQIYSPSLPFVLSLKGRNKVSPGLRGRSSKSNDFTSNTRTEGNRIMREANHLLISETGAAHKVRSPGDEKRNSRQQGEKRESPRRWQL